MIYFNVDDVDATAQEAADAGGTVTGQPQDYFGGRFAVIRDPQGATFGLFKSSQAAVRAAPKAAVTGRWAARR